MSPLPPAPVSAPAPWPMVAARRGRRRPGTGWRPLAALCLLGVAGTTHAARCSISTPSFNFPRYNPLALAPTDGVSVLSVSCALSPGTLADAVNYTVLLSPGSSGSYAERTFMEQPVRYNLYTDPNHTQVWGNGALGTATLSGHLTLPGAASGIHPVYGLMPARQQAHAGSLSDHITVTIVY